MTDHSPNGQAGQSLATWAAEVAYAVEIGRQMVPTVFVPDGLRVWRDDAKQDLDFEATVQTVAMVLLTGRELGFPPMASLKAVTVIKGTAGLYAVAARALLLNAGHEIEIRESTSARAIVDGRRNPGGRWQRSTWDLPRATLAKLYPGHALGNWRTQPKSMLVARATAECCRWVAADALMALPLMVEEIDAGITELPALGAVVEGGPSPEDADAGAEPKPEGRTTRRRRAPRQGARLPDRAPDDPAPVPPPGTGDTPPPIPDAPQITKRQRTDIVNGLKDIGKGDQAGALEFVATAVGRQVDNTGQLTEPEADLVLAAIAAARLVAAPPPPEGPAPEAPDPVEPEAPPPTAPEGETDPGEPPQ